MKKIALMHFAYPPHIGGVEILLREHALLLSELGYRVHVYTGSGEESDKRIRLTQRPEYQSLLNYNPKLQHKILDQGVIDKQFHEMEQKMYRLLEADLAQQDVVIVHNMLTLFRNLPFVQAFSRFAQAHPEKLLIAWTHDHPYIIEEKFRDIDSFANSEFERKLITTPLPNTQYVVISETFKELLVELMRLPSNKVRVITNGISPRRFLEVNSSIWNMVEKFNLLRAYPLFLSPVNVIERKNIEYALSVVAELKKSFPRIRYLITGKPSLHRDTKEYYDKIMSLIKELGIEDQVVFTSDTHPDSLKASQLHDLYTLADAILYFSRSENFGLPILEAVLSKTPIYVSSLKVFHEIGGEYLYYTDTSAIKPVKLAQLIVRKLKNDNLVQLKHIIWKKYHLKNILQTQLIPLIEG